MCTSASTSSVRRICRDLRLDQMAAVPVVVAALDPSRREYGHDERDPDRTADQRATARALLPYDGRGEANEPSEPHPGEQDPGQVHAHHEPVDLDVAEAGE